MTEHRLWGYTYLDWGLVEPTPCPEQDAREKARNDWSVVVWTKPGGGQWVEVETERPDGSLA